MIIRISCLAGALVLLAALTSTVSAAPVKKERTGDGKVLECELLGGTVVPQPPGSAITACCYESGCWICDANGNDCTFDEAYGFKRPVLRFKLYSPARTLLAR